MCGYISQHQAALLLLRAVSCCRFQQYKPATTSSLRCRRWEEGNVSEWSTVTYPDGLLEWTETQFSRMKERQAKLLGIKPDGSHALALPAPLSKL